MKADHIERCAAHVVSFGCVESRRQLGIVPVGKKGG